MRGIRKYNFFECIDPLLEALSWHGDPRFLHEAAPYFQDHLDATNFRNMMLNLGYTSKTYEMPLNQCNFLEAPFLFATEETAYLVRKSDRKGWHVYNCSTKKEEVIKPKTNPQGIAYKFKKLEKPTGPARQKPWFQTVLWRFIAHFKSVFVIALLTSLFTLATPLFIASVFSWVIPSESYSTLVYLVIGMIMALMVDHALQSIKAKSLAYIGARINMFMGIEIVRQILFLPVSMVEGATIGNQVSRIRQTEGVRELFAGPLAHLILETPFVLIFLGVLWYMGGAIVVIPLVLMIVFFFAAVAMLPSIREANYQTAEALKIKQNFLVEAMTSMLTIKQLAMEKVWKDRYHKLYNDIALSQRDSQLVSSHIQCISQMLMKFAGVITILVGAYKVMTGEMNPAYLMAIVILVWRALNPIQLAFIVLSQYDMVVTSIRQLNHLTTLQTEEKKSTMPPPKLEGSISFNNVTFRYPGENNFALQNLTFSLKPKEILAVIGNNSSGKTTLIKLLLNFYKPQAGSILIDGLDVQHYDPVRLRQSIAYVPQQNQFFYGTIEQNLLLSNPNLTKDKMWEAIELAGLTDDINNLPLGIHSRMQDRNIKPFSSGFMQKLNLARAYCRPSSILILDEPGNNLDFKSDGLLRMVTKELSKEKTIILISHRPSLVHLADKILFINNGVPVAFGPKDEVIETMKKMNMKPIEELSYAKLS